MQILPKGLLFSKVASLPFTSQILMTFIYENTIYGLGTRPIGSVLVTIVYTQSLFDVPRFS